MRWLVISRLLSLSDDNEGSSSDTAPLFQMAGDGRSTDDITMPLLFLFHKEGNILLEALKEYREVEVLLSDKARDRGGTLSRSFSVMKSDHIDVFIRLNLCRVDDGGGFLLSILLLFFHFPLFLVVNCNSAFPVLFLSCAC